MEFTLDNFEDEIDDTILRRGMSYYHAGAVIHLEEADTDVWEAIVRGSRKYDVEIIVEEGEVISAECDCPYDWGGPCKHIVATLFAIRDENPSFPASSKKGKQKKKEEAKVEAQLAARMDAVLAQLPPESIRQFLAEQLRQDQNLLRHFLLRYEHQEELHDPEKVESYLQSKLRLSIETNLYTDVVFWNELADKIGGILVFTDAWLAKGDALPAIRVIRACTVTAIEANGMRPSTATKMPAQMSAGIERLARIADGRGITAEVSAYAFAQCLEIGKLSGRIGHDDCRQLFQTAEQFARPGIDHQALLRLYDDMRITGCFGKEEIPKRLALTRTWMGEEMELAFIEANLHISAIRELVIDRAIQRHQYQEAERLAKDGLQQPKGHSDQRDMIWLKCLVRIAVLQGDLETGIKYAKQLFSTDARKRKEVYFEVKGMFPAASWHITSEKLLQLPHLRSLMHPGTLAEIYVAEGWPDRLLALLQREKNPYLLEQFGKHLDPVHRGAAVAVWEAILITHLESCTERVAYQVACNYLRQIRSLGGHEVFDYMCKFIREEFKRRSAFMQELDKL
jgi:hypothetical protein